MEVNFSPGITFCKSKFQDGWSWKGKIGHRASGVGHRASGTRDQGSAIGDRGSIITKGVVSIFVTCGFFRLASVAVSNGINYANIK